MRIIIEWVLWEVDKIICVWMCLSLVGLDSYSTGTKTEARDEAHLRLTLKCQLSMEEAEDTGNISFCQCLVLTSPLSVQEYANKKAELDTEATIVLYLMNIFV